MKCIDCSHLKKLSAPVKFDREIFDFGEAICTKHDLKIEYATTTRLNRLECVEEEKR